MFRYFSFSQITAGFVAVMVGFTSSAVLVFQAATMAGGTPAELSSWIFALGISIGLSCIGLSLRYRMPILIGWSTGGAALLITSLSGFSMAESIGAFLFAALLTVLGGVTGLFERLIMHIPRSLTAAMLAGILLHFGLNVFVAMQDQVILVGTMLITYLIGKRLFPRMVIILVLIMGVCVAQSEGLFHIDHVSLAWPAPVFTFPVFSLAAIISVGIPLFLVNMTSQNIPGITVLNTAGFRLPVSPVLSWTGLVNLLFAPLGCYSISLTALTAAICASPEASADPSDRYKSTIFAGLCWLCIGLFGSTIVAVFFAFPKELVLSLAGLALLGTIGSSLKQALDEDKYRDPALLTILVSASGISFFGIGAACWGLVVGILSNLLINGYKNERLVGGVVA